MNFKILFALILILALAESAFAIDQATADAQIANYTANKNAVFNQFVADQTKALN